jgi:hypothetical protein
MRFGTLALAVLAAFGCSDTSGPSSVAHHLDVLYSQACARAYSPSGYNMASVYWQRCQLLSILVAAPASGAEPSSIRVTTAAGTSTWQSLAIYEYDTSNTGMPLSTINAIIAYSDANVTNAVVLLVTSGGNASYIIANDTITENGVWMSGAASRSSLGGQCRDVSGLSNPLGDTLTGYPPIEYGGSLCHLATFQVSVSTTFPATPGLDPSLESFTIDPQSINGISVIPAEFYFDKRR